MSKGNIVLIALWVLLAIATLVMGVWFVTPAMPVAWYIISLAFGCLNLLITIAFGVLIHQDRKYKKDNGVRM